MGDEDYIELIGPMGPIVMTRDEAEKALKTGKFRLRWANGAPEDDANDLMDAPAGNDAEPPVESEEDEETEE